MRAALLPLLLLAASAAAAQKDETIYMQEATLKPGEERVHEGIDLPARSRDAILVELRVKNCSSEALTATDGYCAALRPGAAPDVVPRLYCLNAARFSPLDGVQVVQYWSERSSTPQQVFIGPESADYSYPSQDASPSFVCVAVHPGGAGDVPYELVAIRQAKPAQLAPAQAEAMGLVFKACCAGEACPAWRRENALRGAPDYAPYTNFCQREGSICDANGNLVQLALQGERMQCELPVEQLAKLPQLRFAFLAANDLSGDLDTAGAALAAALPHLRELHLHDNPRLAGSLGKPGAGGKPATGACALVAPRNEDGSANATAPESGLQVLTAGYTNISGGVPACLFEAPSALRWLYSSANALSGPLPDVFGPTGLQQLVLPRNRLTGPLPASLGNLTSLVRLDLSGNGLTGELPMLPSVHLINVTLSGNKLSGAIPDGMGWHPTLAYLDLRDNALSGFPAAWRDATVSDAAGGAYVVGGGALRALRLSGNDFGGAPFPAGLAAAAGLEWLELANCSLGGGLPAAPDAAGGALFPALRYFDASGNGLTGPLPDAWERAGPFALPPRAVGAGLAQLSTFNVRDNALSGDIPAWVARARATVRLLEGNDWGNGCDPAFAGLGLCDDANTQQSLVAAAGAPPSGSGGDGGGGGGLSAGAAFGIAVAVLAAVAAAVAGGVYYYRRPRGGHDATSFRRFNDEPGGTPGPPDAPAAAAAGAQAAAAAAGAPAAGGGLQDVPIGGGGGGEAKPSADIV